MGNPSFIPDFVLYDKKLTSFEKILYGILFYLENEGEDLTKIKNNYLTMIAGVNKRTIQRALRKLESCNYLDIDYLIGNKRSLSIKIVRDMLIDKWKMQELQELQELKNR